MKFIVLGLGVLSLTGCGSVGTLLGTVVRAPVDIIQGTVSYDEGAVAPHDLGGDGL